CTLVLPSARGQTVSEAHRPRIRRQGKRHGVRDVSHVTNRNSRAVRVRHRAQTRPPPASRERRRRSHTPGHLDLHARADEDKQPTERRRQKGLSAIALIVVLVIAACGGGEIGRPSPDRSKVPVSPGSSPLPGQPGFDLPSIKGLNYGVPYTAGGSWLGTRWLRSGSGSDGWVAARPRLQADLDFIVAHHLGQV